MHTYQSTAVAINASKTQNVLFYFTSLAQFKMVQIYELKKACMLSILYFHSSTAAF